MPRSPKLLALIALGLCAAARPAEEHGAERPRLAEVAGLRQWDWTFLPRGPSLLERVQSRLPEGPQIVAVGDFLLYSGDDEAHRAVHAVLDSLRDELGRQQIAKAEAVRADLLRPGDAVAWSGSMIKITWIGEQTKPVRGLAISSIHQLFEAASFRAFRRQRIHYGNDDLPVFGSFTTRVEEMGALAQALAGHPLAAEAARRTHEGPWQWSISILDRRSARRPNYLELLLTGSEGGRLFDDLAKTIEATNPLGAELLRSR